MYKYYVWRQAILQVAILSLTSGVCNARLISDDGAVTDQNSHIRSNRIMDEELDEHTMEDLKHEHKLWIAGFTISFVFSILNSVGINLQKYSLRRDSLFPAKQRRKSCLQPIWVLGFILIFLGSIMDFVAFGLAPQTLLAPLAALSLVWNLLIAPVVHNETITRENLVATGVIIGGVTITVVFAGRSTPTYDLDDLLQMYMTQLMRVYILCVGSFLVILFGVKGYIESTGIGEKGMCHIVCYGGIAGTLGGQSVLLAKSTVELVKTAIWGEGLDSDAFHHFQTYVIIIGMATCLLFQITTLNGGLKRFDALVIIPVYQSFWILTSVLGGIMYFEEYRNMSRLHMTMFTIGGGVTIFGIMCLLTCESDGCVRSESSGSLMEYSGVVGRGGSIDVGDNEPDQK